jgi:hypothetical protein
MLTGFQMVTGLIYAAAGIMYLIHGSAFEGAVMAGVGNLMVMMAVKHV